MNIIVAFNDIGEFRKELQHAGTIFEKTVRLTGSHRSTNVLPLKSLFLVGTFVELNGNGTKLVKLERYCGQIMQGEKHPATMKLYEEELNALEKVCGEWGLRVMPGIYNFPEKEAA